MSHVAAPQPACIACPDYLTFGHWCRYHNANPRATRSLIHPHHYRGLYDVDIFVIMPWQWLGGRVADELRYLEAAGRCRVRRQGQVSRHSPANDEVIWFIGENGTVMTISKSSLSPGMRRRFESGELKRVNPDQTPWSGHPFPKPPLPEELIMGTLRGYRYWNVVAGEVLQGRNQFAWKPGGWSTAECPSGRDPVPCEDRCGADGYGCGLYGAWTPAPVDKFRRVWGVFEAKGRIVGHPRGFRAEHGRVIALCVPDGWKPTARMPPREPTPAEHAFARLGGLKGAKASTEQLVDYERIAALYQVPLLPRSALEAEYKPDPR